MRSVTVRLDDLKTTILCLGYVGENEHTRINIDAKKMYDQYPSASASLTVCPPEGESYPAVITRDGDMVIWDITDSDLVAEGSGEIQLSFTQGETVAKTFIGRFKVSRSLVPTGDIPSGLDDFLTRAGAALTAIPETIDEALAEAKASGEFDGADGQDGQDGADGFSPIATVTKSGNKATISITDANGTTTAEVTDGADGAPGQDGAPGIDGFSPRATVSKSGNTATITITDAAGTTTAQISDGESADIIDDTAGAGDTDKVWSADKSAAENSSLLTDLNSKADEPTGTKSAGKVYGLDSNLNPAWIEGGGGSVDPQDIQQAVDDWLDENITNPDSPPLDRSLSSASSAAPADMLGDVDAELEMQTINVDLLANATHTAGRKIDADGYIQSVSTYDIYEFDYDGSYDKFDAVLYSSSNYQLRAMTFHNENGVPLETDQFINTSGDYKSEFMDKTIPAGTKKIYLSYRNSMGPISASYKKNVSKRLSDIESDIDTLSVFKASSKNLFDGKVFVGLIYEASGALIDTYTSHRATDYIEISPSTIYTISAYDKNTGAFLIDALRYAFYTSNKTFISGAKPEGKYSTFRTPSTAKYIRFSMNYNYVEKCQLERRSFATNYVPYNTIALNDESDEMFMNFPANIYAVTELEYNLYMFNVRPERYDNEFKSKYDIQTITKIARYGRFLRLKGDNTNTTARVIGAEAKNSTKYGYKLFSINVKNPANLSAVSVLILGDSTTANGYVPQYLYEFGGNSHLITTLGTKGTAPYNHEGRSGWRLYDYFNTSENNPFYNPSTETFDAAYYFTQTGVSQPDIFIINLGINDMHYNSGTLYEAKAHADEFIEMVNAVITSVKGVSSSIKVAICLTTPPNTDPYSFGSAGTNIIDYDGYRIANLVLCEKLIDAYDYRESEGIYLIPINACLDTKYNMPTTTEHPNSRSDLDITVPGNSANVHPNTAGYHQIADEMYAFICSLYVT